MGQSTTFLLNAAFPRLQLVAQGWCGGQLPPDTPKEDTALSLAPGHLWRHLCAQAAQEGRTTLPLALLIPRKLWLWLDGQPSCYVPRRVAVYGGAPNKLQHLRTILINE